MLLEMTLEEANAIRILRNQKIVDLVEDWIKEQEEAWATILSCDPDPIAREVENKYIKRIDKLKNMIDNIK